MSVNAPTVGQPQRNIDLALTPPVNAIGIAWGRAAGSALRLVMDAAVLASMPVLYRLAATTWQRGEGVAGLQPVDLDLVVLTAYSSLSLALLVLTNAYGSTSSRALWKDALRVAVVIGVVLTFTGMLVASLTPARYSPFQMGSMSAVLIIALLGARFISGHLVAAMAARGIGCRRVVVVGNAPHADAVARHLNRPGSVYRAAAIVDIGGRSRGAHSRLGVTVGAGLSSLPALARQFQATDVLVAVSPDRFQQVRDRIHELTPPGAVVRLALHPLVAEVPVDIGSLEGLKVVELRTQLLPSYYQLAKRAMDVTGALVALAVLSPLLVLIGIVIKIDSPGPVLFRQTRVGWLGRHFIMYKFRSMHRDAEQMKNGLAGQNEAIGPMFKIRNDPRVTRAGRWLRRLSLDELPQLLNVLNGTMSLVGPRPPLPEEVGRYQPAHFRRLQAIPGMTGLWQVTRQSATSSFDEMYWCDTTYIETWSPALDVSIILRTVPSVLAGKGAA